MDGIVILISGRGSNLKAIYNTNLKNKIKCVISNRVDALGIEFAKNNGLNTEIIAHNSFESREEFENQLMISIDKYSPKLIVLAGFMRILGNNFVNKYRGKIINIHPSLLPAFPGANAPQYTVNANVKVSGASVHFVTDKVDFGPIIAQGVVRVEITDSPNDLANRILEIEHVLYPFVISKILLDEISIHNGKINLKKEADDTKFLGKYFNNIFY